MPAFTLAIDTVRYRLHSLKGSAWRLRLSGASVDARSWTTASPLMELILCSYMKETKCRYIKTSNICYRLQAKGGIDGERYCHGVGVEKAVFG
ncbi:hypothetical protein V6N13_002308 [Hibiscus sabdariffa]|uniref:Uncharacterized protein n=1 Tax=Hibiscus sabdariffa TaxID=183260 RepID=A0ABR2C2G3_9ROSI